MSFLSVYPESMSFFCKIANRKELHLGRTMLVRLFERSAQKFANLQLLN